MVFGLREVTFPAWTLAAFATSALAGMLIRRVVPAIVAALAVYAALAIAAAGSPREHYLTPLVTSNPSLPGDAWILGQRWAKDGRLAFAGNPLPPSSAIGTGQGRRPAPAGTGRGRQPVRAVPGFARVHAVDQLPAGHPVLAIPVDRGRLAARPVRAADRRGHLAGSPPCRLTRGPGCGSQPASAVSGRVRPGGSPA